MNRLFLALVIAMLALIRPGIAADAPQNFVLHDTPKPLPEITFADETGLSHTLAEFKGRVVLLNIWATWCAPCRKEMPTLDRLQAMLGGPDFTVIALSIDRKGPDVVKKFYSDIGITNLSLYNDPSSNILQAFGLVGLPITLLVNRDGAEIGRLIGPTDWDAPETVEFLKTMVTSKSGALMNPSKTEKSS